MSEDVLALMNMAADSLEDASVLLSHDRLRGCVSRAYYTVFHSAQALLLSKGIQSKSHTGLQHLFSEHFIKTKILEQKMQSLLMQLFQLRQTSDYDFENISLQEAQAAYQKAKDFFSEAKNYLSNQQ